MPTLASGALQRLSTALVVPWLLAAAAAAQVGKTAAPAPPTPTPAPAPNFSELRLQLPEALGGCRTPADLAACESAGQQLDQLIAIAEQPAQREQHPRCLGSLTQLQTHLRVFRWGYERRLRLQRQIDQAMFDCPAAAPLKR